MASASRDAGAQTQGHVVFYGRDARWRRAVAKSLTAAGHSYFATAEPLELRRLLLSQRFDLLALKVRDECDAQAIADALKDVPLPLHKVLAGSASAIPLIQQYHQGGMLRYTPGQLPRDELRRLVEASLSSGAWQESPAENGASSDIEEIDLEEAIDRAAEQVYAQTRRKRQRFNTVVEGPSTEALADPTKLQRALVSLLDLVVRVSPRGALVSVEARASKDDWAIRISASAETARAGGLARLTEALEAATQVLRAAYRDISAQGGLVWVEVSDRAALGVCLALPVAPGSGREPLRVTEGHTSRFDLTDSLSARRKEVQRTGRA
jgi:hypothetical protein